MCVLIVWSIVKLAWGAANVSEIFLARQSYGAGNFGFGVLWAGSGLGLILGGLAAPALIDRDVGRAYVRFVLVIAVGIGCAALAPNVWVGAVTMVLGGFGNGGAVVANITLVQRALPIAFAAVPSRS